MFWVDKTRCTSTFRLLFYIQVFGKQTNLLGNSCNFSATVFQNAFSYLIPMPELLWLLLVEIASTVSGANYQPVSYLQQLISVSFSKLCHPCVTGGVSFPAEASVYPLLPRAYLCSAPSCCLDCTFSREKKQRCWQQQQSTWECWNGN